MKMIRLTAIFALFMVASRVFAADNESLWKEAAEYYDNGNYSAAIQNYNTLLERKYVNSYIFYNLGNAYYKNNEIGKAIWAYRKALRLNPNMEQARSNIRFARELSIDRIEVEKGGFINDIWEFLTGMLGYNGYLLLFSVSWWLLCAILAVLVFRGNFASWPYYLLIGSIIIAIFSATAAFKRIKDDRFTTWGVIVSDSADILEGPGDEFERIEIGHEGLEFKIISEREESYLVVLGNGLKGWVKQKDVFKI